MRKLFSLLCLGVFSIYTANAEGVKQNNVPRATTASLTGIAWYDENANGIQDESKKGIQGIRVHLLKDGKDTGKLVNTDANGIYKFENIEGAHKYSIKVDKPKNYPYFTLQNEGNDDTKDSDIYYKTGISDEVTIAAGENYENLDAGLLCVCKGALRVEKYTNNKDADKEADAPTLEVGDSVTWKYVVENPSNIKINNIKLVDNKEGTINCPKNSLEAHENMTCTKTGTVKAGHYKNEATVTGTSESNNSVIAKDPSNYFGGDAQIDIEKLTNNKDSDQAPGATLNVGYKVTWTYIVKNTGNVQVTNIVVKDNKEGTITCPRTILEPGESMTCKKEGIVKEGSYENEATATANSDVGEVKDSDKSHYTGKSACLGNFMWLDKNLNGVQDAGEPGVVDIKVELYNESGKLLKTTKTDKYGHYMFCGLKPGNYKVKFEQPNTYLFTLKDKGSDLKDSDVNKDGWSHVITIEPGETDLTIDAGIYCECDDYQVNPENYKSVSGGFSLLGSALMLIFIFIATSTLKYSRR